MKTSCRIGSTAILSALLSLTPLCACADPQEVSLLIEPKTNVFYSDAPIVSFDAKDGRLGPDWADDFTLDYGMDSRRSISIDKDGQKRMSGPLWRLSIDALRAKVSVTIKEASFLSALDALMAASPRVCRIECRAVGGQRVSLNVKEAPLGGLLDSLAKLSSARLYILPYKLIIAPEAALSTDEKRQAHPYNVLLTAGTLPDTPEAKALLTPNVEGKTILDIANTKVSAAGKNALLGSILSAPLGSKASPHDFTSKIVGPVDEAALQSTVSFKLEDETYGDVLASFARSIGCELYLTPTHFIICAPDHLNDPDVQEWTRGAVPAFAPDSTISPFLDSKWVRF